MHALHIVLRQRVSCVKFCSISIYLTRMWKRSSLGALYASSSPPGLAPPSTSSLEGSPRNSACVWKGIKQWGGVRTPYYTQDYDRCCYVMQVQRSLECTPTAAQASPPPPPNNVDSKSCIFVLQSLLFLMQTFGQRKHRWVMTRSRSSHKASGRSAMSDRSTSCSILLLGEPFSQKCQDQIASIFYWHFENTF